MFLSLKAMMQAPFFKVSSYMVVMMMELFSMGLGLLL